jgi:hypothetical protein
LGFAKLYDRKTPLVAADLLNDRVIPFFDEPQIPLQRALTDRGTEYCGVPKLHEYELYLAVENIDHTRTNVRSPQTNGIVGRFHKTVLNEFYRVAFRRKIYSSLEQLQATSTAGSENTMRSGRIRASGAMARLHFRHSATPWRWHVWT